MARINAERAARSTSGVQVPQLQVDEQLQADAQLWSAHMAATGAVADPSLPPCDQQANQVCILAANSGNTGYGYWPGDGSDGMNGDYMASTSHRQNQLGAAYNLVGIGVTCSGSQAWTVELFGYTYGDLPSAYARENIQNVYQGDPVSSAPVVAGSPSGDPVYCPGQTYGPNNAVTATGGQYPYPYPVPSVPGEPNTVSASGGEHGRHAQLPRLLAGPLGRLGQDVRERPQLRVDGRCVAGGADLPPGAHPEREGLLDGGRRRRHLRLRRCRVLRVDGRASAQRARWSIWPRPRTDGATGWWRVDGGIFAFGDARFHGSMGGMPLNAPVVGLAADRATGGYWLVGSDGGIFAFDAPFHGSAGSLVLNQPVNGMATTANSRGYWLVAADGAIFAFGNAGFHGSTGGMPLNAPVVGMAADRATGGYWLVGSDGGIFAFDAPFLGRG